jgi:hypothetical protein
MHAAAYRFKLPCATGPAALAVLVGVLLAAGRSTAAADQEKSAVAGDYAGDYRFQTTDPNFGKQEGTMSLSIDGSGKVIGSARNTTINVAAEISGTVDDDGEIKFTIEFSNNTYTANGTVVKTKKGSLRATLIQYAGKDNAVGTIQFDLPSR